MSSNGEHSGRCCPVNEIDETPNAAAKESGYWALANYDRFKGGRKADVEVHGGASLEEALVPIITLQLEKGAIIIQLESDVVTLTFGKTPEIILISSEPLVDPAVVVEGKRYPAETLEENRYRVVLRGLTALGEHTAQAFDGEPLLDSFVFTLKRGVGESQTAQNDDFFDF